MRTTDSISYRTLLENVNMLNERMQRASAQVSSGKRLLNLHDAPADNAEMMSLKGQLSDLDQYQTNADNAGFFLKVADSTLTSLNDLVTSAFVRGSAAASSMTDSASLASMAAELRSVRDQIFSLANTQSRGRYIFAGAQVNAPAFSIQGEIVHYEGDADVNTITISNNLSVQANVPGSAVFDQIFATVGALLTAVDAGDADAIKAALGQFAGARSAMGQVRATLGMELAKLDSSETSRLDQQLFVKTRLGHLGDADIAAAITEVNQSQTSLQAALAAGSLIGKRSLFDYIA